MIALRFVVVVGVCLALILLASCTPALGTGTVGIRLAVDARDLGGLTSLRVAVDSIGVHRAGQPIETGWVTWQPGRRSIDLVALGQGGSLEVGTGKVLAGRYDRARVVVEVGQAQASSGQSVPLEIWIEPIAISFKLRAKDQIEITIELIALIQPDGSFKLFTKSAVIRRSR